MRAGAGSDTIRMGLSRTNYCLNISDLKTPVPRMDRKSITEPIKGGFETLVEFLGYI